MGTNDMAKSAERRRRPGRSPVPCTSTSLDVRANSEEGVGVHQPVDGVQVTCDGWRMQARKKKIKPH